MSEITGDAGGVTSRSPLKTTNMDAGSTVQLATAEVVTFQYVNTSGVVASAVGQPAGTYIFFKLTNDKILNSFKDSVGDAWDSSFSFGTGTVLTAPRVQHFAVGTSKWDNLTPAERIARLQLIITSNGQYFLDHARGIGYGRAAAVVANDTATYSYKSATSSGGGSGVSSSQVQGAGAEGATPVGNPVAVGGVYKTTKPTYANNQQTELQTNVNGALDVNEVTAPLCEKNNLNIAQVGIYPLNTGDLSPLIYNNFGTAVTQNIKATPGILISCVVDNTIATKRYIQFHNTASTPAAAAVPLVWFPIQASASIVIDSVFTQLNGDKFTTGLAMAMSTTAGTYTAASATDLNVSVRYA